MGGRIVALAACTLAIAAAVAPGSALANASLATGYGPTAVTDRDGVTHVVYGIRESLGPDGTGYCRIAPGTATCKDTRDFALPAGCIHYEPDPNSSGGASDVDRPRVLITQFGDVILKTHAFCNVRFGTQYDDDTVIYQSTDGGDTFADPVILGLRSSITGQENGDRRRVWTDAVLDPADRRIVTVVSQDYTFSDTAQYGGVSVQGAPLGITATTVRAKLTDPSDATTRTGGGWHPAIVQRGAGSFVVAWVDAAGKIQLRGFDKPGAALSAINDAANWTPIAGPPETADRPQLVTGPLGTFLMYRVIQDDGSGNPPANWVLRRLDGTTLGPARPVPGVDVSVPGGSQINFYSYVQAASATLVEDQANGRLHFARWLPTSNAGPNHIQYMTSDDGVGWSTNALLPPSGAGGSSDFGVGAGWLPDPWLGESTGAQGFNGVTGNGWLPYGHVFGAMTLPGTAPPTPVDPGGGGGGGGGSTPPPPGAAPAPAPPPAVEDRRCRVLQLAALDVLASACFVQEKGVYVARGAVKVNGLDLAGTEIRFDPKNLQVTSTGPVEISIGATKLFRGAIDWKIPKGNVFPLGTIDVGKLGSKVFGFKLAGDADVKLVRGAVEVHANIGLPDLLGGVSAALVMRADNIAGLHVRELHFGFASAKLGPLELADAELGFNPEANTWSGSLGLNIPPGMSLKASIAIENGVIKSLAGSFSPPAPGFPLDPFGTAYLTTIRAGVGFSPLTMTGGLTIGAGPLLSSTNSSERFARVDGDLRGTFPDAGPSTIRADGVGSVVGIPVATAFLQFVTDGHVSAGAGIKYGFGPFTAEGVFSGWFYKGTFNLEGEAEVCAGVCIGGQILLSSKGFAACARTPIIDIGAGISWGKDLAAGLVNPAYLLTKIGAMPIGCSVGDYREAAASAAQAGAERKVTFAAGLPAGIVGVIGADAPPHVALVGPDGTRIEPTAGAPVNDGRAFAFQAAAQRLTWFAVKRPKPGVWRIVPEADSSAIVKVSQAAGLAPPKVSAKVVKGKGRSRVLTYKVAPAPGQEVAFAEDGGKGTAAQLGKATGATGRLTFTPTQGPGGIRRIVAMVTRNGIPRANITVARYTAPPRLTPARPRARLRRSGTTVVVTWRKDALARRYEVRATLTDGRVLILLPKKPKVTITKVARTTALKLTLRGIDAAGVAGPRAQLTGTAPVRRKAGSTWRHR